MGKQPFIVFLMCILFLMTASNSFSADYDFFVSELRIHGWQQKYLNPAFMRELNEDEAKFRAFVHLVNNVGLDWRIRIRAINILAESRSPKSGEVLLDMIYNPAINNECPAIKSNLALGLGNYGDDPRVVDALIYALDDTELLVREASIISLGNIGAPKSSPFLIKMLDDDNFAIKMNAVRALGRTGGTSAAPALRKMIGNEKDEVLKGAAMESFLKLTASAGSQAPLPEEGDLPGAQEYGPYRPK